jgi:hypothetical protein
MYQNLPLPVPLPLPKSDRFGNFSRSESVLDSKSAFLDLPQAAIVTDNLSLALKCSLLGQGQGQGQV